MSCLKIFVPVYSSICFFGFFRHYQYNLLHLLVLQHTITEGYHRSWVTGS